MKDKQNADSQGAAMAIDQVLAAEAGVRQAMQDCNEQAEQIVEAAREDARRILRTANHRAGGLHERCDRLIEEAVRTLREQASQHRTSDELDPSDLAQVDDAVARVAARLTGTDS